MVSLRAARVDDQVAQELLAEYFGLRAETFPGGSYRTVFPDPAAFEEPDGVFFVLHDDDGTAVGCGGIRAIVEGPAGRRFEVKHLYLRPQTRGRGWGRLLLTALEEAARERGGAELVLDTHHTLEAAGGLYASSGFMPIKPYNDNANATVWLRKVL